MSTVSYRKSLGLVFALSLFLVHLAAPARALSETLRWTRIYDSHQGGVDGEGIATDSSGGVYATGQTVFQDGFGLLLLKYSGSGVLGWSRTYRKAGSIADDGKDIAVGTDGSLYVTGSTFLPGQDANLLLQRFSSSGILEWTRTFNGGANGHDCGAGVAVGPDGGIYVTGDTYVDGHGQNLLLQKYSADGIHLWTRTYNRAGRRDEAGGGVAVGADGSVYVSGSATVPGESTNLLLQKYSSAGILVWTRTYSGAPFGADWGAGVAVAPEGSIYVAGSTRIPGQGNYLLLQKYSSSGTRSWTRAYSGIGTGGRDVAVGADADVFVVGTQRVGASDSDLLLQKYSASGTLRWTKTFNGGIGPSIDGGSGIAVSRDGGIYVTGQMTGNNGNLLLLQKYK